MENLLAKSFELLFEEILRDPEPSEPPNYRYVPIKHKYITKIIENLVDKYATEPEKLSFFDVGCGYGNVLLMARAAGFGKVGGVEIDRDIVEWCIKTYLYDPHIEIKLWDANEYEHYGDWDVIFMNRPVYNFKPLVAKIYNAAKPGTYFLFTGDWPQISGKTKMINHDGYIPILQK